MYSPPPIILGLFAVLISTLILIAKWLFCFIGHRLNRSNCSRIDQCLSYWRKKWGGGGKSHSVKYWNNKILHAAKWVRVKSERKCKLWSGKKLTAKIWTWKGDAFVIAVTYSEHGHPVGRGMRATAPEGPLNGINGDGIDISLKPSTAKKHRDGSCHETESPRAKFTNNLQTISNILLGRYVLGQNE